MEEIHHYYDEDFFKKYGWVSCYECDKIFYDVDELIEHQEKIGPKGCYPCNKPKEK